MTLLQDLRYAVRGLARQPGFAAVAILTLGLAIGANTIVFSVADALLLRSLPLPKSDQLAVMVVRRAAAGETESVSVARFHFLREQMRRELVQTAAESRRTEAFNLSGDGTPQRLLGASVTADFLPTLGVAPMLGRNFLSEEDLPGARHTVILSHHLWTSRFGADRHVLGHHLVLNGQVYTVVGVMPASFRFPPSDVDLWTPFGFDPAGRDDTGYFRMIGRLRDGVTIGAAAARAHDLTAAFGAAFPGSLQPGDTFTMGSLQERLYGKTRPALLILVAATLAVLLIACVNLANLQLARAAARRQEMALRAMLGASGGRLVRQLLTEGAVLGFAGALAGLAIGAAGLGPLVHVSPLHLDALAEVAVDGRVVAFTVALSLVASLLFGLVPALQAGRVSLAHPLAEGSGRTAGNRAGAALRRVLVIAEVALAVVLITSALLLVRSFQHLLDQPLGFTIDHVLTMKLSLPPARYGTGEAIDRFTTEITGRITSLPGVSSAALISTMPLEPRPTMGLRPQGRAVGGDDGKGTYVVDYRALTPDLFKVLRMTAVRGRLFTAADRAGAPGVAVINQRAAQRIWPGEDPVGRQVQIEEGDGAEAPTRPCTIVGIVADTGEAGVDRATFAGVYVPISQMPPSVLQVFLKLIEVTVTAHTTHESPELTRAIERQIWAVDPSQPINDVKTLRTIRDDSLTPRLFSTLLLGLLAGLALVLAAVGVYGVLAYLVRERRREIGVRMALGSTSRQVTGLVLRQAGSAIAAGLALGMAGALLLTRLLGSQLYGIGAHDPLSFALAPAFLAVVAALASAIPAWRASRLDPLIALRQD